MQRLVWREQQAEHPDLRTYLEGELAKLSEVQTPVVTEQVVRPSHSKHLGNGGALELRNATARRSPDKLSKPPADEHCA